MIVSLCSCEERADYKPLRQDRAYSSQRGGSSDSGTQSISQNSTIRPQIEIPSRNLKAVCVLDLLLSAAVFDLVLARFALEQAPDSVTYVGSRLA